MKKLTVYQKRIARLVTSSGLATIALLFSSLVASALLQDNMLYAAIYLPIASLALAAFYVLRYFFEPKRKFRSISRLGLCGFYVVMAVIGAFVVLNVVFFHVYSFFLSGALIFTAVTNFLDRRNFRAILLGALRVLLAIALIILFSDFSVKPEESKTYFLVISLILAGIGFVSAMFVVFTGVKRTTVGKILRKTYSVEILYGLVVLIVSTALVLSFIEEEMANYGDALWYCFALVTTIGFGDITAHTIVGRILSVILGIYGIVVVALITSIIVNFYNETKEEDASVKAEQKQEQPPLPKIEEEEKKEE